MQAFSRQTQELAESTRLRRMRQNQNASGRDQYHRLGFSGPQNNHWRVSGEVHIRPHSHQL